MGLPSDVEAGWLACAIDGEGSIGVSRARRRDGTQVVVIARVTVGNTSRAFIEECHRIMALTGARPNIVVSGVTVNGNTVWKAQALAQESVHRILTVVLPFLIIKRQRAEIVMGWIERRREARLHRPRAGGGTPYGDETAFMLEALEGI